MADRPHRIILDPRKVRAARLAKGYPERVLAGVLGVSNRVIDRIEAGSDQSHLDVRFLADLAAALGRDLLELLHRADTTPALSDADTIGESDPQTIGAVLAAHGGQLHIDLAARELRWTRARALAALRELDNRLRLTGQRLAWLEEISCAVVPGPAPAEVVAAVSRRDLAEHGINLTMAEMLHQLISTDRPSRIGDWDPHCRDALIRAGLLELDPNHVTSSVLPISLSLNMKFSLATEAIASDG